MRVLVHNLSFVDGLRWRGGRFWFSDMHAGKVQSVTPEGDLTTVVRVPGQPSGLGWTPDGDLLVVSMSGQKILRLVGRQLVVHSDMSALADRDCNDMLVDADGSAYVGCMGFDFWGGESPSPTRLLRISPGGEVSVAASGLMCPNGMVLIDEGRTLLVAESFGERITAFSRAPDGKLGKARLFADLKGSVPDSMCQDAAGQIWVADCRRRRMLRLDHQGAVTSEIETAEGRMPVGCAVGGAEGETLVVSTRPAGRGDVVEPAGRLETVALKRSTLRVVRPTP